MGGGGEGCGYKGGSNEGGGGKGSEAEAPLCASPRRPPECKLEGGRAFDLPEVAAGASIALCAVCAVWGGAVEALARSSIDHAARSSAALSSASSPEYCRASGAPEGCRSLRPIAYVAELELAPLFPPLFAPLG